MSKLIKISSSDSGSVAKLCVALGLVSMLSGCGQDMGDLVQYVNEVKARPAKAIEPIPVIKPYVRFIYPGHDLDPFDLSALSPTQDRPAENSIMIDKNRLPEYLEKFPLDSLKMVGTVFKEGQLWALIRVPGGSVHRAKEGNYLGRNHGKILKVNEPNITLSEIVENGFGGYERRDNELAISSPNKKI
uniref:Type IV pilus biogenesis protein PilP n=1 Tax=uncultured Thiotrichaceae bacterium TaxID=298394 RepID=A0A6S6UL36_9GAMM|nr:MAG: Type IV pilus biogenesis protein PilP [uncultured Thiotrichaceae bacterium]